MLPSSLNLKQLHQHIKKPEVNLNIMLRVSLPQLFSQEHWEEISTYQYQKFISIQQRILQTLLENPNLFNKYFSLFYQNHIRLYHWYLLSNQNKAQVSNYIFKKLLNSTLQEYKEKALEIEKAKQNERIQKKNKMMDETERNKLSKKKEIEIDSMRRATINQYSRQIFTFLANKSTTPSLQFEKKQKTQTEKQNAFRNLSTSFKKNKTLRNIVNNKSSKKSKEFTQEKYRPKQKIKINDLNNDDKKRGVDFHDLYIRTFYACDGLRYIFYNYEKHMKGLSEKDKYNTFIRLGGKKQGKINNSAGPDNSAFYDNLDFKVQEKDDSPQKLCRSSLYEYHQFGSCDEKGHNMDSKTQMSKTTSGLLWNTKSQMVFRRIRSRNNGKFIRKML